MASTTVPTSRERSGARRVASGCAVRSASTPISSSPVTLTPAKRARSARTAISVAGLLDRVEAGVVPKGARVVLTVTGHGLKDPQWALRNADGSQVEPTVVDATTSDVASVLGLKAVGANA